MVRIKICGITNLADAKVAIELGADALGFVFAKSKRRISSKKAAKIINQLPPIVNFVGLFVNERNQVVEKILTDCKLSALQFHGDETPEYCREFRKKAKVIKAVRVKDRNSISALSKYDVDAFLLDTFSSRGFGGTGKVFNWEFARIAKKFGRPIILAGGLNPKNVAVAIKKVRPFGVDVSGGIESSPGKKDKRLMKEFILKARRA